MYIYIYICACTYVSTKTYKYLYAYILEIEARSEIDKCIYTHKYAYNIRIYLYILEIEAWNDIDDDVPKLEDDDNDLSMFDMQIKCVYLLYIHLFSMSYYMYHESQSYCTNGRINTADSSRNITIRTRKVARWLENYHNNALG
jgi:hypothetical protein